MYLIEFGFLCSKREDMHSLVKEFKKLIVLLVINLKNLY